MKDFTNKLIGNFPFEEIRPQQQDVLEKLGKNWEKYKYFILECPTGFGLL